jgi:alcohol dehydrogenase class IV
MSRHAALQGASLIAGALDESPESRDPAPLALGSILCGYAIDSGLFGLHHVVCQTLVRVVGTPHAKTNAAMLPLTMEALASRVPLPMSELGAAIGGSEDLVGRLRALGGDPPGVGDAGGDASRIDEAVEGMLARSELNHMPNPPAAEELRRMVDSAW